MEKWVASQRFHQECDEDWYVHQRGGNRPHKLPLLPDRQTAQVVAELLNLYEETRDDSALCRAFAYFEQQGQPLLPKITAQDVMALPAIAQGE